MTAFPSPHEALDMKSPAEVHYSTRRSYQGISEPHYPGEIVDLARESWP
jgi:hypothetical protein